MIACFCLWGARKYSIQPSFLTVNIVWFLVEPNVAPWQHVRSVTVKEPGKDMLSLEVDFDF
jgi:hypothetical protein